MDLKQTVIRSQELRAGVDRLMQNVRPSVDSDHPVYEVEMCHDAALRGFFAGLLIDSPIAASASVWPLLEERVPADLLNHPRIQQQKEYLSRPLACTPTELLTRMNLFNEKGPWAEVQRVVQQNLTPDQRGVLLLVEMALER